MPRKAAKKVELKKTKECGLQRIDTMFSKAKNTTKFKSKLDSSVIVLSDDEDDFKVGKKSPQMASKAPNGTTQNESKVDAEKMEAESFQTRDSDTLKEETASSNIVDDNDLPRTPPTPDLSEAKKMKPLNVPKPISTGNKNELDHEFKKPSMTPSQSPRKLSKKPQSCPATPVKPPPPRNAYTSPKKKAWANSPFRKFPVRKVRSAPAVFKSLEMKPDPYYLANFKFIVLTIYHDKFYDHLFNEEDRNYVNTFKNLTRAAKMLYIRLFQRKLRWLQGSIISYDEIAKDLIPVLEELTTMKFMENQDDLSDLKTVLTLMPAPDLKEFGKEYKVNATNKEDIIDALIKRSNQKTISAMFGGKSNVDKRMLEKSKAKVGSCFRLLTAPRDLFMRCLALFSLTTSHYGEDDHNNASSQIFNLLHINRGVVEYPIYVQNRQTQIYKDRDSLVETQRLLGIEAEMTALFEKNEFEKCLEIHLRVEKEYLEYLNKDYAKYDRSLPSFLQPFTAGAVFIRLLNRGIEILQKLKKYSKANELLERLLAQKLGSKYRGMWYDRLALNLDSHCKSASQALGVVQRALADDEVKSGRRLALYQRAEKVCNAKSNKALKDRLQEFSHYELREIPTVTIEGEKMTTTSGKTSKSSFIKRSATSHENVELCSVEEIALAHYKSLGFDRGVHKEGATQMTLLMLYLWDVVFESIPDVFYNDYQLAPLDLYTDDFYSNRKDRLDNILEIIRNSTVDELIEELEGKWKAHEDVVAFGLYWNIFRNLDDAKTLVRCLGGQFLSAVFKRHVESMRSCRSGVPDLIVWSSEGDKFKIVEVKGPGDRLSTKQILWLDYYLSLGAEAEVCHVAGVGAKRLKKTKTSPAKA